MGKGKGKGSERPACPVTGERKILSKKGGGIWENPRSGPSQKETRGKNDSIKAGRESLLEGEKSLGPHPRTNETLSFKQRGGGSTLGPRSIKRTLKARGGDGQDIEANVP